MHISIYLGITVDQYYLCKHKYDLQHPYLPCIALKGGGDHIDYFPLEVLEVLNLSEMDPYGN
jgi:hypothetical protein